MREIISYKKRRGIELFLVLLAQIIGLSGFFITSLNTSGDLPQYWIPITAIWFAFGWIAHLAIRWRLPYADPIFLPVALLLNGLGLSMISRLSNPLSSDLMRQIIWTGLGLTLMLLIVIFLQNYRALGGYPYLTFLAGILLILLPLVPKLGINLNGARIWIRIFGFSFQPAEIAKIAMVIAFAAYLSGTRDMLSQVSIRFLKIPLPRPRDLGPIFIVWLLGVAVMVFEKDLGTALLFFGLFVAMLYLATEKISWPIIGIILFFSAASGAYKFFSHVRIRFDSWLNPFANFDQNYQIIQSQFGMAYGGLLGTGWGLGRPSITPLAQSDFIFPSLGEELGMLGMTAIVLLYLCLANRGLRTALTARDPFSKLLSAGLTFVFSLQVFIIIAGVTRLMPLTGLTTPFMSQGGSSLIANWILIGLLLVISHEVRKPYAPPAMQIVPDFSTEETQIIGIGELR